MSSTVTTGAGAAFIAAIIPSIVNPDDRFAAVAAAGDCDGVTALVPTGCANTLVAAGDVAIAVGAEDILPVVPPTLTDAICFTFAMPLKITAAIIATLARVLGIVGSASALLAATYVSIVAAAIAKAFPAAVC